MERDDIEELAEYNSRVAKGIEHTQEYKDEMVILQEQFDKESADMEVNRFAHLSDEVVLDVYKRLGGKAGSGEVEISDFSRRKQLEIEIKKRGLKVE